jgi:CheY-like chemotaxis protein
MNGEAKRVVLVDDSDEVRRVTELMLMASGWDVVAAVNSATAGIAAVKSTKPDVVVTDLQMPGVSGFDLIRALRFDPRTSPIPIVLLTATSEVAQADLSVFERVKLLHKPASMSELKAAIQEVLAPAEESEVIVLRGKVGPLSDYLRGGLAARPRARPDLC